MILMASSGYPEDFSGSTMAVDDTESAMILDTTPSIAETGSGYSGTSVTASIKDLYTQRKSVESNDQCSLE